MTLFLLHSTASNVAGDGEDDNDSDESETQDTQDSTQVHYSQISLQMEDRQSSIGISSQSSNWIINPSPSTLWGGLYLARGWHMLLKRIALKINCCKLLKNLSTSRMKMKCSVWVLLQHFEKYKIHKRRNMLNFSFSSHYIIACMCLLLILNQMYFNLNHKFQCPNSSKIITIWCLMVMHLLFRFICLHAASK